MRALSIVIAVGLGACSSGADSLPGALAPLAGEVTRFEGWSLPGLTLYRRCMAMPDRSTCSIVGVDADGVLVPSVEIFRRLPPELTPLELAQRAHDLVLGEAGQEPLRPGSDRTQWGSIVSDEEWSVVAEPVIEGGAIVFFTMEGEMDPTAMRVRVDRATGRVTRENAADVWIARAPVGAVSCEPVATCGCEMGCLRVDTVRLPRRGDAFRALDRARSRYFRESSGFLRTLADEECAESCPPAPPSYRCELHGEACERITP